MGLVDLLTSLFGTGGGDGGEGADSTATRGQSEGDEEFTPDDFRRKAEEAAEEWEDLELDFSLASVERLDEYARQQSTVMGVLEEELDDDSELRSMMEGGYALEFGSYFGEVLASNFDGEWAYDDGWGVVVPVEGGVVDVAVFDIAAHSFTEEPVFGQVVEDLQEGRESAAAAAAAGAGAGSEMAAEAEELAAYWSEYDLDFSPASLARLDDLVDAQWEKERFREAELGGEDADSRVYTGLVTQLGSYYGEVLVRTLDAEWIDHDQFGTAVEVAGPGEEAAVANVFHVAADCLTEPSKFALNYDTVADQLGLDVERVSEGGEVLTVSTEEPVDEVQELDAEDVVEGFREDAAELVAEWPGYDLDYSPESLERLDRLVAEAFADFDFTGVELGEETDGDSLFLTAHAMETGGYLAEVLRRNLGGEWRAEDGLAFVVEGRHGTARIDPVAIAADCFRGEDSFAATYEAIRGRLSVPERTDDEPSPPGAADGRTEGASADADAGAATDAAVDAGADERAGERADVTDPDDGGGEPADEPSGDDAGPRPAAEALAGLWPAYDLDFTPESLARLDDLLARELSPDQYETVSFRLGAYLGEVFVRTHGGEWIETDEAGWVVAIPTADGDTKGLDIPGIVRAVLEGDATFAGTHEAFVREVDLEGGPADGDASAADSPDGDASVADSADGDGGSGADPAGDRGDGGPAAGDGAAERHRALAERLAGEWPGYDLDFSVESLARLDALATEAFDAPEGDRRADALAASAGEAGGPTEAAAFGGYLAEVFRRHHGAEWRPDDGEDGAVLAVAGEEGTATFDPAAVATRCLTGEASFVGAYAQVAADVGLEAPVGE